MASSIPFTTAYSAILTAVYSIGEALTGLHPYELTDLSAERVGLGADAGFADILIAALSSS